MRMRAALFDLDGTLVDSMWVWDRLMVDFLTKYSLPKIPEVMEKVTHMSLVQSAPYVKAEYSLSMTAEEILNEWMEMVYHAYAEEIRLKAGAGEYLAALKKDGVRIGLVTACAPELCSACLKNNGIDGLFDAVVYVDDVGKGKNFPDIYIECLKRLGCKPTDAVLFEDILTGIRTAKKIGLRVVAVEEDNGADAEVFKQEADLYIKDFHEMLQKRIG